MIEFKTKLNAQVENFIKDNQLSDELALKIRLSHKNRQPNSQVMQYLNNRMNLEAVNFNLLNIKLDIQSFETLDIQNYVKYAKYLLFQYQRYYMPYQLKIAEEMHSEFELHVYFPTYFKGIGKDLFIYKLNDFTQNSNITVDTITEQTYNGLYILSKGTHTIDLQQNDIVLQLFNDCIIENTPLNYYIQTQPETITIHATKDTQIAFLNQNNSNITIELDDMFYIFNYQYQYSSNGHTKITEKVFHEPIVQMLPLRGVEV